MLLTGLLTVGAVAIGTMIVMVLIYYVLAAEAGQSTERLGSAFDHHPVLDDDLLYLASTMVPYPEYAYFPTLAISPDRQEATQPATAFRLIPLSFERQEATQPA